MSFENVNIFFALIMLAFGIYCLYLWVRLCRGTMPDQNLLLSKERTMKDCLDAEEYVSYMKPRTAVFGVLTTLFGAFSLADAALGLLQSWTEGMSLGMSLLIMELTTVAVPFAVLIWFAVCLYRIQKKLWV